MTRLFSLQSSCLPGRNTLHGAPGGRQTLVERPPGGGIGDAVAVVAAAAAGATFAVAAALRSRSPRSPGGPPHAGSGRRRGAVPVMRAASDHCY